MLIGFLQARRRSFALSGQLDGELEKVLQNHDYAGFSVTPGTFGFSHEGDRALTSEY